ncbi:MAG: tetratricopeptide repeat protein [Deltaproteobacteria bacterium]|nr:tetratricopeptide repeat protein [Deltaproteobacteria bacterium]
MAVNKRKILEAAQKYLQKGVLDRALKEYRTLLEVDPRDCSARLKLGDIHLRLGEKGEAVNAYLRVAQQFMKEGFDAKAVALFKQIAKLAPEQTEVFVPLAELYQRLGLVAEAMSALQVATEGFQKAGRKREALDLLRKAAALDPSNTTSRLKIAELLRQQDMTAEALAEYDEVATELERAGEHEALACVYERILEIEPTRLATVLALARLSLASGSAERACTLAGHAAGDHPDLIDALELHAEALQALGRAVEETEPVFRRLAEAHRERGNEERAREILQRFLPACDLTLSGVAALDLGTADGPAPEGSYFEASFVESTGPSLAGLPETELAAAGAPAAGGIASDLSEPPEADLEQLLAEAGVYVRFGKRDRAIASLEAALARQPDHPGVRERLAAVLAEGGEAAHASSLVDDAAASPAAPDDSESDVASDLAEMSLDEFVIEHDRSPEAEPIAPAQPVAFAQSVDAERHDGAPADWAIGTGGEFEVEFDLSEACDPSGFARDESAAPCESHESGGLEIELEAGAGETSTPAVARSAASESVTAGSAPASPKQILEGLEEAAFYVQQGLGEEAERIYRRILEIAPTNPQALLGLGEIAAARGDDPAAGQAPIEADSALEESVSEAPRSEGNLALEGAEAGSPGDDLAEWDDFAPAAVDAEIEPAFDVESPEGVEIEAEAPVLESVAQELTIENEPGVARLVDGQTTTSVAPEVAGEPSHFDLAAEISHALGTDDATACGAGPQPEESLEAIFDEFKRGVRKTLTAADHETHYDLGIAYREMGLVEDAMGEFQIALESPARRIDCLHLLGVCARELKRPNDAVAFFEQALADVALPPSRRAAIRFDLAIALEERGELRAALAAFEEVAAEEPSHPGLAERIDALRAVSTLTASETKSDEVAEVYESFDDLIAHAEADLVSGNAATDSQASETKSSAPETGDRPRAAPASGTSPRRRKISFG